MRLSRAAIVLVCAAGAVLSCTEHVPTVPAINQRVASAFAIDRGLISHQNANEPAGYSVVTDRSFASKASVGEDTTGAEGWEGGEAQFRSMQVTNDITAPRSAPNVMRVMFAKGSPGGVVAARARKNLTVPARQLYISLWMKISASWQGNSSLIQLVLAREPRLNIDIASDPSGVTSLLAFAVGRSVRHRRLLAAGDAKLSRDTWHRIELLVKSNTPGAANGLFRLWLDGTPTPAITDLQVAAGQESDLFQAVQLSSTWGRPSQSVPNTMYVSWDHVYASGSASTTSPMLAAASTQSTDNVVFSEGFESGTFAAWQDGVDTTRHHILNDSSLAHSGTHVLQMTYPAGKTGGWLTHFFPVGYDSLYVSYWIRFDPTWSGSTPLLDLRGSRVDNQWSSFGKSGVCPTGSDFFTTAITTGVFGGPQDMSFLSYYPGMTATSNGACYGNYQGTGTTTYAPNRTITLGAWHQIGFWVKLNTIGQNDAIQRLWLDGQLTGEWTRFPLRLDSVLVLNALLLNGYAVAPQTQHLYVDDIVVSTTQPASTTPPPTVASVSVTLNSPSLTAGQSTQASALVRDASGNVLSGQSVTWSSTNPAVATVDSTGLVTAVAPGATTISATTSGIAGSATITVTQPSVASISVTLNSPSLTVGQTTQAVATLRDAQGNVLAGTVQWSSSGPSIGTVNSTGLVSAVSVGTATITAVSQGITGSAVLTVQPPPVASVTVVLAATSIITGQTTQATALLKDATGDTLTGRVISWASSAPGVATVTASGLVTAVSAGTASITATSEGVTGSATITVKLPPVASVVVTLNSPSLTAGQSTQAVATLRDASGNLLTGRVVTWSSSNTTVAKVDATGLVTTVVAGTASISATSEGVTSVAPLTVLPVAVAHVTVTLAAPSLTVGQSTQATVQLTDASGNVLTGRTITWASSNTMVATVNASGLVAALAAGTASISATSEGITGAATLNVSAAPSPPPATGEPMFQTGTDVSLFTEDFESYSSLTALLTYNSALARYTYYGQQYFSFPSPGGGHTGANAFRNNYPVQSTYLDDGGFINSEAVPNAPATHVRFMVIEFWLRTSPGYPWRRQGASDQQGAGEKTLVWNAKNTSSEPRFVLEPGLAPCCKGQYWGGKYDAAFPSNGVGIVMAADGSSVSGGVAWYFQNLNAATRSPVGYMNDGNWHLWKIKLTPSTLQTGSSGDGSIEMWVDGVKVLEYIGTDPSRPEYNKVLVPTTVAAAFSTFGMGGPFNGGPSPAQGPQWKDYDDVRIWYQP